MLGNLLILRGALSPPSDITHSTYYVYMYIHTSVYIIHVFLSKHKISSYGFSNIWFYVPHRVTLPPTSQSNALLFRASWHLRSTVPSLEPLLPCSEQLHSIIYPLHDGLLHHRPRATRPCGHWLRQPYQEPRHIFPPCKVIFSCVCGATRLCPFFVI